MKENLPASEALERLRAGNERYLLAERNPGDVSPALRLLTAQRGQQPYAVVLSCSDSRVVPEAIFSAGLGELFTVRTAGNTAGAHALGSIEYAVEHLGCRLVLVLGHEGCGAVSAAMAGERGGHIGCITSEIGEAIGAETDAVQAAKQNALAAAGRIRRALCPDREEEQKLLVAAAIYRLSDGSVAFL